MKINKWIYKNTGLIKIKILKYELVINYGKLEISNSKKINLVFLSQFNTEPFVFISPISKGDLINKNTNISNAIYAQDITNKGFSIVSQRLDTNINDVVKNIYWIAIGR